MRVLVIDDTQVHIASAKECLSDHELVTASTYDQAVELIERRAPYEAVEAEAARRGISCPKHESTPKDKWGEEYEKYRNARQQVEEELRPKQFDAVLSDLIMPASREPLSPDGLKFAGQLMPVGFALALLAAKNGAKYVAVVTATNHHNHPASAMLDRLSSAYWSGEPAAFTINGATAGFYHAPSRQVGGTVCEGCKGTKQEPNGKPCYSCGGTGLGKGKDWAVVLAVLQPGYKKPDPGPGIA